MNALGCFYLYDLRHGFTEIKWRLALLCIVCFAVLLLGDLQYSAAVPGYFPSFGDYLFILLAGKEPYVIESNSPFTLPMAWLVCMAVIAYVPLAYPTDDLAGIGTRLIAVNGSRMYWLLAKQLWVLTVACAIWAIQLAACALFTALHRADWSLQPYAEIASAINVWGIGSHSTSGPLLGFVLAVPALLCAILTIQHVIALLANPIVGFGFTVTHLLAATFFMTPFLPGNHLMAARQMVVLANGMRPDHGLALGIFVTVACAAISFAAFKKKNILSLGGAEQ